MHSKSLRNFIRMYIIFFLCVCFMFVPIYVYTYITYEEQEKNASMDMLQNGAKALDDQIMSLMNLVQITYTDIRYRALTYQQTSTLDNSYYQLPQLINNFKGLIGSNNLVTDAGIIINDEVILTRYRSFLKNYTYNFYTDFFSSQGYEYQDWLSLMRKNELTFEFLPAMQYSSYDFLEYTAITFVTPWTGSYKSSSTSLFYATIKTRDLINAIASDENSQKGYVLIYDVQGNLLFNHQYISSDEHFTISSTLPDSKLRIVVGIPNSIISEHIAPVRIILITYIVVILLISIILVLIFSYRSNIPIRKMVSAIEQSMYTNNADRTALSSEYDYIANAMTDLNETIYSYSQTIEMQKSLICTNIFEKALNKGLHNTESIADFKRLFPRFPNLFQLAAISYESNEESNVETTASLQLDLLTEISKLFPEEIYKQLFDEHLIIILLPIQRAEESQIWVSTLETFYNNLTIRSSMIFQIALSQVFADSRNLSHAFLQIRNIFFMARSNKDLTVWQLNNFPQRAFQMPLDYMTIQQLYDAQLAGDIETTQSILDNIMASLMQEDAMKEIAIHQTCDSLHNLLLRIKIENISILSSIYIPINNSQKRISKILKEYYQCCIDICNIFKIAHAENTDNFSKSICSFILDNFTNDGFYTKMVSDHFGISDTTLQKIIKNATGKTFSKYIEDLRLEKAYDLLKNADVTINDISTCCGFASPNSFYKAFRRKYAFPPSVIRSNRTLSSDLNSKL